MAAIADQEMRKAMEAGQRTRVGKHTVNLCEAYALNGKKFPLQPKPDEAAWTGFLAAQNDARAQPRLAEELDDLCSRLAVGLQPLWSPEGKLAGAESLFDMFWAGLNKDSQGLNEDSQGCAPNKMIPAQWSIGGLFSDEFGTHAVRKLFGTPERCAAFVQEWTPKVEEMKAHLAAAKAAKDWKKVGAIEAGGTGLRYREWQLLFAAPANKDARETAIATMEADLFTVTRMGDLAKTAAAAIPFLSALARENGREMPGPEEARAALDLLVCPETYNEEKQTPKP